MSDNQEYNQQFEPPPSGAKYEGSQAPGGAPPPGPPPPQPVTYAQPEGKKSQALAGILSGLIPGLGNIYVGFYTRGFVQALVFIFCIVALSSGNPGYGAEPLFGIFLGFWWFFGIIDAVRRAGAYNQYLMGATTMPEMPKDLELPSQGSKSWGLGLIVVGFLFFLNTKFGFNLEWLEEWWPMILVGFGAWLYYKAKVREREKAAREE